MEADIQTKVVKTSRVFLVTLAVFAISLACSFLNRISQSQALIPTPGVPVGLIAYVGNDGNIYTTDRNGKLRSAVTRDASLNPTAGQVGRFYESPAWAPDGHHLAFVRFSSSEAGLEASLFSTLPDGKRAVNTFTSQEIQPFYLSWSPDSQYITFLGSDGSGALVHYLAAGSGGESKMLGSGQPYYWDWSPDSRTLIVHIGGEYSANPDAHLAFITLDSPNAKQVLELKPGPFDAPAWSPAGDVLALAVQNDAGDDELILAGADGKTRQLLAQLRGRVAFAWSPKGVQLAYAVTDLQGREPMARLFVMDSAHPDLQKQIAQGKLVAFFWSPDGQKIAYFTLENMPPSLASIQTVAHTAPSASLLLRVYDRTSGETKAVASFVPTISFQQVLPFYSQYQRSGTIWSPDSQSLVLAGIDSAGEDAIYTVDVDGSQFQKIAAGNLAFWSWK
jgi:TolB protein